MTLQVGSEGNKGQWLIRRQEVVATARFIEALVESAFGIARSALHAPQRGTAEVAFARQVAIYLVHVRLGLTYAAAGRFFGRDRTTAAYACRVIEERREEFRARFAHRLPGARDRRAPAGRRRAGRPRMRTTRDEKALRLLGRLAKRDARLVRKATGSVAIVVTRDGARPREEVADAGLVETLIGRGLVVAGKGGAMTISAAGVAAVRRRLAGGSDGYGEQHQDRGPIMLDDPAFGRRQVTVNHEESPLAWLRRRKDASGRPMIDASAFAAGERLRADYERAQLMPRVTANWTAAVAGRRRSGENGIADLTESALAARRRVEAALTALEPEMASLAVDFCCFLKGLERIESERRWPARSAKVVLRLTLAALARHYGLSARARGADAAPLRHWGAEGYRPEID